jgi:hypothetical protein
LVHIDIRVSGTATTTAAFSILAEGVVGAVSASSGQTYTNSSFFRLLAGSSTGLHLAIQEFDSASSFLRGPATAVIATNTLTRYSHTVTTGASTSSLRCGCFISYTTGQVVNITLRIAAPQLNLGELQPYYPTTGSPYFGPRLTYDPSNLSSDPGLLAEEARTNSIRNSTMQGASAGTPGTFPTNWSRQNALSGLQVDTSYVTSFGAPAVRFRFYGVTSANPGPETFEFEGRNVISVNSGQSWAASLFNRVTAGTIPAGTQFSTRILTFTSAGALVDNASNSGLFTPIAVLRRATALHTATAGVGTGGFITNGLHLFNFPANTSIDFTVEILLPQLELGASASSPIPTFGTALTRSADNLSMTDLSWYQQSGGVFYSEAVCGSLPTGNVAFVGTLGAAGTSFNFIDVARYQPTLRALTLTAGVSQSALATSLTLGVFHKTAHAFSSGGARFVANGGAPLVDTSVNLPTPPTLFLGWDGVSATRALNGIIREIAFIPNTSIPDSALQRMTR